MSTRSKTNVYRNAANVDKLKHGLKAQLSSVKQRNESLVKQLNDAIRKCEEKVARLLTFEELAFNDEYNDLSRFLDFFQKRLFHFQDEIKCEVEDCFKKSTLNGNHEGRDVLDSISNSNPDLASFKKKCSLKESFEIELNECDGEEPSSRTSTTMTKSSNGLNSEAYFGSLEADLKWREKYFDFRGKNRQVDHKSVVPSGNAKPMINGTEAKSAAVCVKRSPDAHLLPKFKIDSPPPVPRQKTISVVASYVVNPSEFYLHYNPKLALKIGADLQRDQRNWKLNNPKVGMHCAAIYPKDGLWYRAKIIRVFDDSQSEKQNYDVYYIDYGNVETVTEDDISCLIPDFLNYEPQAVRCCLCYCELTAEWKSDSIELFKSTLEVNNLTAYFYNCMAFGDVDVYSADVFFGDSEPVNCINLLPVCDMYRE